MARENHSHLARQDYSTVDSDPPSGGVGSGSEDKHDAAGPESYSVITCSACGNVVPLSEENFHPCWLEPEPAPTYEQKALDQEVLRWVRSLPTAHPNDWDADDWTHFEVLIDNLPDERAKDAVWEAVSTRWMRSEASYTYDEDIELAIVSSALKDEDDDSLSTDYEAMIADVESGKRRQPKSVHSMTDAEFAELEASLQGSEDALKEWFQEKEAEAARCVCDGPGSETNKYLSHLASCPANPGLTTDAAKPKPVEHPNYARTKYGTDPKVQCLDDCAGPGHPRSKYGAHLPKCPCYLPYNSGTSSSYTSNYVKKDCKHIHDTFKLEGGLEILASAARDVIGKKDVEEEDPRVDIGVYLASSWQPKYLLATPGLQLPWYQGRPELHIDWPDYKTPKVSDEHMLACLKWVLTETEQGKMFETGCVGGHGRTGTFLASLLTLQGVPPATAIQRVRSEYCKHAIESYSQIEYIAHIHQLEYGKAWRKSRRERRKFNKLLDAEAKPYTTSLVSSTRGGDTQPAGSKASGPTQPGNRYKWNYQTKTWDKIT